MKKNVNYFNVFIILIIALCFAVIAGGCGGGGGTLINDNSNTPDIPTPSNPISEENSVTRPQTIFNIADGMDLDGNGKPDFLDFYGVSQIHIGNSSSAASSGRVSTASSVIAAAEMNLPVPSMVWLYKLRSQAEDPNTFLVTLDAGNEYTFEFSKNLTNFLGGTLPNIKIYDPANAVLSLDEAQEITDVEITAYPKEHPSIFCYTIKPEVSGHYLVQIQNGEPISNTSHDFDNTDSVLFIYKERRNENGEPGYYTNFKFTDSEGTQTTALNISDIIELRKLFIEANPTYFDEIYGQNLPDDEYGMGNNSDSFTISDDYEEYDNFLELVQAKVGVVYSVDLDLLALLEQEYMSEADFKKLEAALIAIESLDITAPNYETELKALLKDFEQDSQNYEDALDGVLVTKVIAPNINASNVHVSAGVDDMYTTIPSDIDGIPYEDRYHIGRGIMAITMLDPPGGMEVGTIKDAYQQAFAAYDYDGDNTSTSKDASMHPRNTDTLPLTTDKYIKFISTASQAESLTKTNSEVSIATSALGISAGTGSTNNFKFGITSTTLVIHFEETEIGYRELTFDQTLNAWNKAGFFNIISSEIFYQTGPDFVKNFRNDFGDYYVAGYQYGACYDAYISITTKTSEQLEKVTSKLSANLNLDSFNASFDLSRETQKTLSEAGAEISIRIITNGMGHGPQEIPMPQGVSSRDLKAVDHVFATISDFNGKLTNNSQRSQYAPIRVKMNRWKNNLIMGMLMKMKGDTDGRIPVTIGQKKKILALNSKLRSLRAYRNVVTDNPAINGTAAKEIEPRFSALFGTITGVKEEFYTEKYQADFESVDREVDYLIPKFKAFADRYAFHTKLVLAQQAEKKLYNDLLDSANKFEEGSSEAYAVIKQMPFGKADVGGSSGYGKFPFSEFVIEDMKMGETISKRYKRNGITGWRLEWKSSQTAPSSPSDQDYWPDAGPSILEAKTTDNSEAVFCQVTVNSISKNRSTDRHRELEAGSSPAVGKSVVKFYFMSGRGDDVDWNIEGKSMRMRAEDYPFQGLE